jgi:starch phosphorylase
MKPIYTFNVNPKLPEPLERLRELAYNLRWAWDHDTIELFRRLDSELWETTGHNPVLLLGTVEQRRLEEAAADESFLAHLDRVYKEFDDYLQGKSTWFLRSQRDAQNPLVAYFSAEFGLTECLSIFAGGLGVLAGDHLKSASDLGVPLVGVGLLYQQGYFRQYLNAAGWQQEAYEDNDFHNLPLMLECRPDGTPVTIEIFYPGNKVVAQIWRVRVGRISLYLLDTNTAANTRTEDRDITDQLYGGDLDMRIRQEILLGIGGCRALQALGIHPTVYHMNEGHSAFLSLELVRRMMEREGLSFEEARELASSALIFTTHTPVEAGHDYFPADLIDKYFPEYIPKLGLTREQFLGLGRRNPGDGGESFCMTVLALRMASFSNGVSDLHGQVSRRIWKSIWPGVTEEEMPIGHVTNGVHFRSWISYEMNQLYDRYLGPSWREQPAESGVWARVQSIPAEELWRTHERRRERLVAFARRRLQAQLKRRGVPKAEIDAAEEALDPHALTIGFARRFATYKRATLFLKDKERLKRILNDPIRPVQIIFAGKAHPRDDAGKDLIRQIGTLIREPEFRRRMVFIEDYDMSVTRYLVQGADVWLNTPLRPNEASGTSGMKAVANGVINLSTLDGWWDEAWRLSDADSSPIGWAIGRGEIGENREYQDQLEAAALYELLERDVVPKFFERRSDGIPREWIKQMKASIGTLCHFFNTHRMVREYTERFYLSADALYRQLLADGAARARALADWKSRVRKAWPGIHIELLEVSLPAAISVGDRISYRALVSTGSLKPEDLIVELCLGKVNAACEIVEPVSMAMGPIRKEGNAYLYEASSVPFPGSGLNGCTARVLPHHPDLRGRFLPGLIHWAESKTGLRK